MFLRLIQKTSIIVAVALLFSCKAKKAPVLFVIENKAEIKVNSACRNSSLLPLSNDAELKNKLLDCSNESIAKLKLKKSSESAKATYRIVKTELLVTQRCDNPPSITLEEVLTLENTVTAGSLQFRTDTLIGQSAALSQPASVASQKIDFKVYIGSLTLKNYQQLKKYCRNR